MRIKIFESRSSALDHDIDLEERVNSFLEQVKNPQVFALNKGAEYRKICIVVSYEEEKDYRGNTV